MSPGISAINSLIQATKPFRVVLLTNPWYECLEDTARLLSLGLGCPVLLADPRLYADSRKYRDVILGLHASPTVRIPLDSIVYQTEHPSTWSGTLYHAACQVHETWTYSAHARPGPDSKHVPLGYHPDFPTIAPADEQDIDVLFFGSLPDRRMHTLEHCMARGLKVKIAPLGTFGKPLQELISRSKVVLNVHYYTNPACFEFARVVPLVHSGVCVLSEESEGGEGLGLAATCEYSRLAESAEFLVKNPDARTLAAKSALRNLKKNTMQSILEKVL